MYLNHRNLSGFTFHLVTCRTTLALICLNWMNLMQEMCFYIKCLTSALPKFIELRVMQFLFKAVHWGERNSSTFSLGIKYRCYVGNIMLSSVNELFKIMNFTDLQQVKIAVLPLLVFTTTSVKLCQVLWIGNNCDVFIEVFSSTFNISC